MNLSNEYDIYDIYKKDSLDLIDYYINKYPTSFESNEIVNLFQKKIYNKKISLGKKRGRENNNSKKTRIHDRNSNDNIRIRIKIIFFDFLIFFLNIYFKPILKDEKLYYIIYEEKKKNSSKDIKKQFNLPISEILKLDIKGNYKDKKNNFNLYENIIKKYDNQNFTEMKIYEFYENIFLKSNEYKSLLELLREKETPLYFEKFKNLAENLIDFANIEKKNISLYNYKDFNKYIQNYFDNNDFYSKLCQIDPFEINNSLFY